jgi:pyochelin synthetase
MRLDVVAVLAGAQEKYRPKPYAGDIVFLRAAKQPVTSFDPLGGWRNLVSGKIEVCEVPGDHLSMLGDEEKVRILAHAVAAFLPGPRRLPPKPS